jgi:hypothetical protein
VLHAEKYKLVVKPHKIGSFFMYLKVGKKTGNFISATLFYNAANVTKEQSLMKVFRFKKQNANKSNIMTLIFFLVVLN